MCGLVGIAGDTSGIWKDIFTELLIIDSIRGTHSTGVGHVSRYNAQFEVLKRPGQPFNLILTEQYKKLVLDRPCRALIGHNRYATLGAHTEENAHPFSFEHVMGAHNGTLDKWTIKDLHDSEKYDTDSQAIFSSINEWGSVETLKHMQGAWALTWYDKRSDTLNFLRNDRRPLFYCYSHDHCTLIWASEVEMLKLVMARHNKKVEDDKWFQINPNVHYSWKIPENINKKFDVPDQVDQKGKTYEAKTYDKTTYYGGWTPHKQYDDYDWLGATTGAGTNSTNTNVGNPLKDQPSDLFQTDTSKFKPPYKNSAGRTMNKQQFFTLTRQGCSWCADSKVKWGDFIFPFRDAVSNKEIFICEDCYNGDDVSQIVQYLCA